MIVGVPSSFPVPGFAFILGNDLAQGNVWGTSKPVPSIVVVSLPVSVDIPDECGQKFPHAFPTCAVTRAIGKQLKADRLHEGEVSFHPVCEVTIEKTSPVHSENYVDESDLPSKEVDSGTVEDESLSNDLNIQHHLGSSDKFSEKSVSQEDGISEHILSSIFNVS